MSQGRLEHPGRWLWLLLLVPIIAGFSRLRLDVEVFNLLPADLPAVQGLQIHQRHFANARELILTFRAASPDTAEAAARAVALQLRKQTNLANVVTWQPPWLEHPEWAAELLGYLWLNQPPEIFLDLSQSLASTNLSQVLAAARETLATSMSPEEIGRLSYDPFGLSQLPSSTSAGFSFAPGSTGFASSDGKVRLVFVQAASDLASYQECQRWLQAVRQTVHETLKLLPDNSLNDEGAIEVGYTGRPAFVAEIADGMQSDMTISAGGTAVIIALLFYAWHRRLRPMLWLLFLLGTVLGGTLGLGGLLYGSLNVVSLGFAAILLGLAVDYAVVHYQEAISNPSLSIPRIRRVIAPSITWAAATTIAAFLTLNFGGLPGLGQLGTLVAIGVTLAAGVMVFEYLPPLFPARARERAIDSTGTAVTANELSSGEEPPANLSSSGSTAFMVLSVLVFVVAAATLTIKGFPAIDPSAEPLRPAESPAYEAMDLVRQAVGQEREPFWLIVSGQDEQQVASRLAEVANLMRSAKEQGLIKSFTVPLALWPNPSLQQTNRHTAQLLAARRSEFHTAADQAGFAPASLALLERVLDTWSIAAANRGVFWPTNPMSSWVLEKLAARTSTNLYAFALLTPAGNESTTPAPTRLTRLQEFFARDGMWLTGWELLGDSIYSRVRSNFLRVLVPMIALVLLSLWIAYKRLVDVALNLLALALSVLCLLAVMRLSGWSWNLLNLMAVPLVLGTGVDYGIFILLGLRRHGGNLARTNRAVTRALVLCGATAITGFGSLAFSSNAGMASLGKVCAAGIACNMAVALLLLPAWWLLCAPPAVPPRSPSSLYRAELWKFGLWLARRLPYRFSLALARTALALYWHLAPRRREVVVNNLLPVTGGTRNEAYRAARRLYRNFAIKVTDLLRYEAGLPIESVLGEATHWDLYLRARDQGRGVLLVTPHLGNWEFGASFLTRQGEELQVITLAEPGRELTELRQQARSQRNIKTLVIGEDPFAFLEIIRRLESGATVALLVDRPPPASAVPIKLFGHEFPASIAAAELARASGCVLLPVYVPRAAGKYDAHLLPPISYVRSELRDRQARRQLTERLLQAFEPVIKDHLDQWYHFVPVWGMPATLPNLERKND